MSLKREITSGAQFLDEINSKFGTELNANATPSMLLSAFKVGDENASYYKTDTNVVETINDDTPTEKVRITLDLNGGYLNPGVETYFDVAKDSYVLLSTLLEKWGNAMSRSTHEVLLGFSTSGGTSTSLIADSIFADVDITVYAIWGVPDCRVTLDFGDGKVDPVSASVSSVISFQTKLYEELVLSDINSLIHKYVGPSASIIPPSNTVVITGWSDSDPASGTGGSTWVDSYTVDEDITLYAIWEEPEYVDWDGVGSVKSIKPKPSTDLSNDSDWSALKQEFTEGQSSLTEDVTVFTSNSVGVITAHIDATSINQYDITLSIPSNGTTVASFAAGDNNVIEGLTDSAYDNKDGISYESTSSSLLPHLGPVILKLIKVLK